MKRWLLSILVGIWVSGIFSVGAQDWVKGEGFCPAAGRTPKEALEEAIQSALRDAIMKHCGADILSETVVNNFMLGADVIENITSGHVVEYQIVRQWEENPDPQHNPLNNIFKVELKAQVVCDTSARDPLFTLKASLNKTNLRDGEEVQLQVVPSRDCYLTVLNILPDQSIYQLYPLKSMPQEKVAAGETWHFPLTLVAQCPPERDKVTESLYIIATREPVQLVSSVTAREMHWEGDFAVWETPRTCWKTVVQNLIQIPRKLRTSTVLTFTIHKK